MHRRWKTKQIPIRRTGHAANEGMHPFAHADDVGAHVFLACLFILRPPTQDGLKDSVKSLRLTRLSLFIFISLIYPIKFIHEFVINCYSIFFCNNGPFTGDCPCQALPALHLAVRVVSRHSIKTPYFKISKDTFK